MSPRTALTLWVGVAGLVAAALVHAARRLNVRLGWVRPNYAGVALPAFCGVAFPAVGLACIAGLPLASHAGMDARPLWVLLGGTVCFAAVGLTDDLYGSAEVRGILGHVKASLASRRVTTGMLKLLLGGGAAVVRGLVLCQGRLLSSLVAAAVIALSANAINLLDTRPGRAPWTATAALCALFLLPLARGDAAISISFPLWPFLIAAETMALSDGARRSMMGDVGSNSLGAVVGIGFVLAADLWVEVTLVVALLAATLVADRYSLTTWLERNRQ
ncbi:MAG: hypothetical protein ACE5O2_11245 [Armatimonadota bacterium]